MRTIGATRVVLCCVVALLVPALAQAGEKYALLIGVRQYEKHQLRNLQYTEADIVGLAAALQDSGYRPENVVIMTQTLGAEHRRLMPVYANILKELRVLLRQRDRNDTVLVAFAGHGIQFRGSEECFFCPMDANLEDRTTLVGLKEVYHELEQCRAGVRLLIDDTCRDDPRVGQSPSLPAGNADRLTYLLNRRPARETTDFCSQETGPSQPVPGMTRLDVRSPRDRQGPLQLVALFGGEAEQPDRPRKRPVVDLESVTRPQDKRPPRGVAALFSCAPGQRAFESDQFKHGVFFNFVIEGLRGKADLDGDKEVTLEELVGYASKHVKDYVRKEYNDDQVPIYSGEAPGGLVLVTLSGPQRASLGAPRQNVDFHLARRLELRPAMGVQLSGVLPGLAAAKAGLRQGDVLVKVNGTAIADTQRLETILGNFKPGDMITVDFLRSGDRLQAKVVLEARLSAEELARRYAELAKQGEAWAQYELGRMYALGDGVAVDYRVATRWFSQAAEQGLPRAQYVLGVMYQSGSGVASDNRQAAKWYRQAAEKGHSKAQNQLGLMYQKGLGVEKDDREAVNWLRQAAEQGEALAQVDVGMCYQSGRGIEKDDVEAVKWYRRAAKELAIAQRFLGFMYRTGRGVERDDTEAFQWYRRAAENGDLYAEYNLGNLYRNGWGVKKDYAQAIKYYRQVADKGLPEAQFNMGLMYLKGWGVAKSDEEAVKWFHQAAEQENVLAQRYLGLMYLSGRGVTKDPDEAVKWLRRAAEQGDAEARKLLARLAPE
jgi:TPR repeat protein